MKKPITVLHILYELRSSGAEIMIKNATQYWQENGVVQHILSTAEVKGNFADALALEGIIIHHIPYRKSFGFLIELYKFFRLNNFNVVHIHLERTFLTYSIIARLARVPTIIRTLHSTYLFEGLTKFNRSARRRMIRILGVIQVSVSIFVQENEQKRFHNPTLLINNWFDDSHFYPPSAVERQEAREKFVLPNDQKVIVSVGNCAPVKNHESIIRALGILDQNEFCPIYWHIGEEDAEEKERKLVNVLNLNAIVKFWGRQEDIRSFLWAADVFVMPSFREGFGVAALEAYATGITVVLARSPGLEQWESIFPDVLFTEPTSMGLTQGIKRALNNDTGVRKVDRKETLMNFGTKRGAEEYLALYKRKNAQLI